MSTQFDDSKPYSMVTAVGISYFHPDSYNLADIEQLRASARADPPSDWMRRVKQQFTQALEQHLDGMDVDEFVREVQPGGHSVEIFVRRMWAIIFPDDPIPGGPSGPFDALYTIADIYFGDVEPEDNIMHPRHLIRMLRLPENEQTPLLQAIKPELTRMLQGDVDGLDLKRFRSMISASYRDDDKDFARHVWRYLFPDEALPEG